MQQVADVTKSEERRRVKMSREIRISAGPVSAMAELNDTPAADAIWQALPITGNANTWGDEIYFGIPVEIKLENGKEVVDSGDLAYWPPGKAFCIFFGLTPASRDNEIRPASAVEVFGRITGDPKVFGKVNDGEKVTVAKA
jgi:hypothetical protein